MTTLNWRRTAGHASPVTTSEVISEAVEAAPDYYDGKLEAVERKLNCLIEIVAEVTDQLPPDTQRRLVEYFGRFGWEEVK